MDHWRRGHKQMCKKIHRGGNAEQYHADKKYKEAVAVAVEACADDTKGQKCYICLEAVHPHTGEGLVRGCACGDRDGVSSPELGVAHVSCLARQAKILREDAEEDNLGGNEIYERWKRWDTCSLCEQKYHGVVRCALGWACWKTYVGRPENDEARIGAMTMLGLGLNDADDVHEALRIFRSSQLATLERLRPGDVSSIMICKTNLALCCSRLHQDEEALALRRETYSTYLQCLGPSDETTLLGAHNLACSLRETNNIAECMSLMRETMPIAKRVFGADHEMSLRFVWTYGDCIVYNKPNLSHDDLLEAIVTLEEGFRRSRRVLGPQHPITLSLENILTRANQRLH